MLPGPRTAPHLADSAADPFGWRLANALAIAAPYLLAAVLFLILYRMPLSPPAPAAQSTPPAPVADRATASEPTAAPRAEPPATPNPVALSSTAAPAPAKSAAPPTPSAASPTAPPTKDEPLPTQPVPVEANVAQTMKLSEDVIPYPAAALGARIQGTVVLAAVIGADGTVQSVQPVSGPALLEAGAMDAVRSWRYHPYLIYGKPVAFQTQIILTFQLDSSPPQ